jgi:hypothetical protein
MGLLDGTNQATYYGSDNAANYGNYQFTTLENIINAFMITHVGEGKIINKVSRTDVQFHAMRAIQELSYDVLRSFKSQEIEVPNTLSMVLPQDYVNYIKLVRVGPDGLERPLYPARKTSDPFAITQNEDGIYQFEDRRVLTLTCPDSTQITDGDYLELYFMPLTGESIGSTTSEATGQHKAYFIFDTDSDPEDGAEPSSDEIGPRFTINLAGASVGITYTSNQVATLLAEQINLFGKHTAVVSGGTVTVTYKNELTWNSSVIENVSGLIENGGGVIENFQSAGDDDTTNNTNFTLTVTTTGAGNNTITEQVPSNTSENFNDITPINYQLYDINYSSDIEISTEGRRYGLDPQFTQINGTFFIDQLRGLIKFGATLAGETVTLHYVSDGLGTDSEMVVHKFCEEACYKHIAYGVLSTRSNIPEYIVQRYKKERFAETRKAKIRLSNIKIEEFAQVLKGMGKQIK